MSAQEDGASTLDVSANNDNSRNKLPLFLPHVKCGFALFSFNDNSINGLSLFILNVNVQCADHRRELPFNVPIAVSHRTIRRVRSTLRNFDHNLKTL